MQLPVSLCRFSGSNVIGSFRRDLPASQIVRHPQSGSSARVEATASRAAPEDSGIPQIETRVKERFAREDESFVL